MIDPAGRVVLISGANRGIGRAIADCLHGKGYTISAGARDVEALDEVLAPLAGDRLLTARYDAADRDTHTAWVEATGSRFGRIDALVNNAGASNDFRIDEGEEAELDALWQINAKGPLFLTRACLPLLETSGQGRVLNVASLSGKRVANDHVAYAMTKFAVMALTHATRRLGWEAGIRATALCPGFVATDMTTHVSAVDRDEMIQPEDLAEIAALAIALPNTANVAEFLVNPRLGPLF